VCRSGARHESGADWQSARRLATAAVSCKRGGWPIAQSAAHYRAIAYAMGITEGTVKTYLYRLFRKLGMNDRLDLALYGLKNLFGGQLGLERSKEAAMAGQVVGKPVAPCSFLMPARRVPGVPAVH